MSLSSLKIKRKQLIVVGILVGTGTILVSAILWSLGMDSAPERSTGKVEETNITTVGQRINPQEVWVERLESENKLTQNKIDALEKLLMSNIKASKDSEKKQSEQSADLNPIQTEDNAHSSFVSGTMNRHMSGILPPPPVSSSSQELPHRLAQQGYVQQGAQQIGAPVGIRKIVLKLSSNKLVGQNVSKKSTVENTIPAGAFAKATLLGGVDASTSITAQNDPHPILLRVTDHGNLPRRFKSDLKACHVLASAYGDLSSERVYMRLEKLTCTERLTGEISETQVSGYVVGEDGRAGVRGVVADRAGPLIRNSLVGGFLSGMSNFFGAQQQRSVYPISPFGQTNALKPEQMLSSGAANGASTALDKYADFFIKRAEQLQPVLQVAAGRAVNIVFTQGTEFGETSVKKTLSKIRQNSRKEAVRTLESREDDKNWLPSVGEIKEEKRGYGE